MENLTPVLIEENSNQEHKIDINRFKELVKKAREHRYIFGKLSRGTRMDSDGPEQNTSGAGADYGWSSSGDPNVKEGMMYVNSVKHFPEKIVVRDESRDQSGENKEFHKTRFVLKIPIKDSTDVMLADVQITKGPPEDPRHLSSLKQTTNKTFVRLAKDEADELINMYREDPTYVEKFYKACFPALDSVAPETDRYNGVVRIPQDHLLIVEDITAKIDGKADFNSRFAPNPDDIGVWRRWFDQVKLDTKNYIEIPQSKSASE